MHSLSRLFVAAIPGLANHFHPDPLAEPNGDEACLCDSKLQLRDCCGRFLSTWNVDFDPLVFWPFVLAEMPTDERAAAILRGTVPVGASLQLAVELLASQELAEMVSALEALLKSHPALSSVDAEAACSLLWHGYDRIGDLPGLRQQIRRLSHGRDPRLRAQAWIYLSREASDKGDPSRSWEMLKRAKSEDADNFLFIFDEMTLLASAGNEAEGKRRAAALLRSMELVGQLETVEILRLLLGANLPGARQAQSGRLN
jgi:hypothetical protein